MTTISVEELFLVTLVFVDDWYKKKGWYLRHGTVGDNSVFSDSEMLTLMLAMDFFEFTSERRYHAFIAANYRTLFPQLPDQSQYNHRARSLRYLLNYLHKEWASQLGVEAKNHFLLDTTPVSINQYDELFEEITKRLAETVSTGNPEMIFAKLESEKSGIMEFFVSNGHDLENMNSFLKKLTKYIAEEHLPK